MNEGTASPPPPAAPNPTPPASTWPPVAVPGQPSPHAPDEPPASAAEQSSPKAVEVAPAAAGTPEIPDAPAIEGDELLARLRALIARFVVLPSDAALDAATLWVAATHLQASWQHAPRLAVVGPAKRCGKSRLLDVLAETVHNPVLTVNSTPAAVFRSITEHPPTLLVDEADTIFGSPKMAEKGSP